MKKTKRKGFNFFRSYFDVYNELESNEDKVAFIDALLDRQFMGLKPTNLKGMAKFAYISQSNSIDCQVKGYEDKTKTKLNPLEDIKLPPTKPQLNTPNQGASVAPRQGGGATPSLQVQEKEKEKEEEKEEVQEQVEVEFLKIVCDFFSQTTEVLEMRVNSYLRHLKNNGELLLFKNQTNAYMAYKEASEEKIHSWLSYQSSWKDQNWIDKLSKIKKNEVKKKIVHSNR